MGEQTQTGTKKAIRLITPSTVLSIKHLPILRCTKQSIFSHLHHQRVKKLLHTGDPVVVEVGSRRLSTGCNWFQRQLQLPAVIIVPQSKLLKTAHRQIRRFNNNTMDTDYPCRHSHRREYSVQSHLSVCLFVRAPKGKRLELSTPNSVSIYSIAVARHALTQKSKGQRSHGYKNRHGRMAASDHVLNFVYQYAAVLPAPLPAWVCMSIRLPMFSSSLTDDVPSQSLGLVLKKLNPTQRKLATP